MTQQLSADLTKYKLGINQIINAIPSYKENKSSLKDTLSTIDGEQLSGSSIAPLYRLDAVKTKLNLSEEQVSSIIELLDKPTLKQVQTKVKALIKKKSTLEEKFTKVKNDHRDALALLDKEIKELQDSVWK
jgi:hypothetical protein